MKALVAIEAKVRRIGTGYGILIPKKTLEAIGASEGDVIVVKRIERPAKEIRGLLKGSGLEFRRETGDRGL